MFAQRRNQKLVEIASAPALTLGCEIERSTLRPHWQNKRVIKVSAPSSFLEFVATGPEFVFIEANARLQVEHTVTEAVTGCDLVPSQIQVAMGASLASLGLDKPAIPRGFAVQARVIMETLNADGSVWPGSGTLSAYQPPSGPGVRVDGFGYVGYETSTAFDSLLAKVIVAHNRRIFQRYARKRFGHSEFRIEG